MGAAWNPPEDHYETSNLARLMRSMGADPRDYNAFHAQTVADPAAFVEAALDDLGFPWHTPPHTILEGWKPGDAIHGARWYRGARANVYDAALTWNIDQGRGDQVALIWENEAGDVRTLTFQELRQGADAVARALAATGVAQGEVVAAMVPTVPEAVMLYYGLMRIGAVFSPVATDMAAQQIAVRLDEADVRVMVGCDGVLTKGRKKPLKPEIDAACEIHGGIETLVVLDYVGGNGAPPLEGRDVGWDDWIASGEGVEPGPPVQLGPDDLTMVLFSSGTTGTPKGTRHGWSAWIEDVIENAYAHDLRPGDRSFWLTNVGWMMFPWLLAGHGVGGTVVLYEGAPNHPGPDRVLQFAAAHGVTHMGLSPDSIKMVVDAAEANGGAHDLSSLRVLRNTGAPLTGQLFDRTLDVLGIAVSGAWGGTDGCFCLGGGNPVAPRTEASMRPGPGMDVHVMAYDEATGEYRDTRPDEIGEVVVQTPAPSMTKGLINDPDDTRFLDAYFRPKTDVPADVIERQGLDRWWFHGDLARMDEERNLWILGRADDLLVVRGINTDPTSVQNSYADLVQESAPVVAMVGDSSLLFVFAVPTEDGPRGDELQEQVRARVKEHVSPRVAPTRVFEVSGVPRTVNGKPQFRLVRDAFLGRELGDTTTLRNPEVLDEVRAHGDAFFER